MKKERIAGLMPACKLGGAALALLMLAGMASCGGNNDPNSLTLEVKPELGDLGEYMTVESTEATISLSEFTDDGEPYVKIASNLQVKISKDVATNYDFDLDVEILDKNMNKICSFGDYDIDDKTDYDMGEFSHYLKAGDYRAVMDTKGPKKDWDGEASAMWEIMRQTGKYIVLKPRYSSSKYVPLAGVSAGGSSESSSDELEVTEVEVDEVAAVSGSEDWDKILDEYEAYCTKLASYAKKAKAGDMSAMTEYASLLESAESLQKKLENAGSDLSVAQAGRLQKIAAKMTQSMM
ncbi:MAG: hypothetical protein K2K93_02450 [Muribaculaceae bacterium]|nr:hypothetical protein [Muribaculaceae bacterium]